MAKLRVYHGSGARFSRFDPSKFHTGADAGSTSWYGDGFYLSGEPWKGASYAYAAENGLVYIVDAEVSRPFFVQGTSATDLRDALKKEGLDPALMGKDLSAALCSRGYDSVVVYKTGEGYVVNELVVFDPDRLKIVDRIPVAEFKPKDYGKLSAPPDYFAPARGASQTINEAYRDAALRHQIDLRRYTAGLTKRVARLLEEADRDLTEKLRARLARFAGRDLDFTGERWKALLADIRGARAAALQEYKDLVRDELGKLAVLEGNAEVELLQSSVAIEVSFMTVSADQLRAIATSSPFQGRLLNDWFKTLEQVDQQRLVQAIQLGMVQGEPIDDIVRRVVGTRKNAYADGILAMTRRDAQGIVRTAVNHVSNTARGYVWDANSDIITAKVWVSTLDGRTTAVCRARDGKGSPVGDNDLPADIPPLQPKGAKPPAHINCRSVMVAYIDGVGLLGNRPTVTDTRTRKARETDFRAEAKARGVPIQQVRKEWAEKNVGRVPAATTYQDFLKRQPASFQDEVLGKTKGELFRKGGLTVDQFVDRNGTELTLSQLAKKHPEAFQRAFGNEGGKLSLSDGTPVGDWHAASFAEAPDWLQSKVRTLSISGVTSDTPDQTYFSPSSKKIEMDGRTTTDRGHQAVWRHEVGHALDHALRGGGNLYRSQSLDYTAAQIKDKDELLRIKKALDKSGSPPLPAGVPSPEDLSKLFSQAGINEAELEEFLRAHTFVGDLQGIGLRARKARMLQAWNNKDIQEFVDALILPGGPDPGYSKGVLGNITDLTSATTWNELCPYNKGYYGHSPEYYKRARAWGGYEGPEAFANLTALAGAAEPFAWKIAQRFFPEQVRVYLEIMK